MLLLFLASDLIDGFIDDFHDMKFVEGNLGLGKGLPDTGNKSRRPVAAGLLDLFGISLMRFQVFFEGGTWLFQTSG